MDAFWNLLLRSVFGEPANHSTGYPVREGSRKFDLLVGLAAITNLPGEPEHEVSGVEIRFSEDAQVASCVLVSPGATAQVYLVVGDFQQPGSDIDAIRVRFVDRERVAGEQNYRSQYTALLLHRKWHGSAGHQAQMQ